MLKRLCPLLVIFWLSACTKSDTPPAASGDFIVNTWKVDDSFYTFTNKVVTIYKNGGDKTNNVTDLSDLRWQFRSDKTFTLVQSTGTTTGTWTKSANTLTVTDTKTLKSDSYTVEQSDATHLNITLAIAGASLSKGDMSYLNSQYNVDVSSGYTYSLRLIP